MAEHLPWFGSKHGGAYSVQMHGGRQVCWFLTSYG